MRLPLSFTIKKMMWVICAIQLSDILESNKWLWLTCTLVKVILSSASSYIGVFTNWKKNYFWCEVLPCIVSTVVPIFLDSCRNTSDSSKTVVSWGFSYQWWLRIFPYCSVSRINNRAYSQLVRIFGTCINFFITILLSFSSELLLSWYDLTIAGIAISSPDSCFCSSSSDM